MSDQRATAADREGEGARLLAAAARQREVALAELFLPPPLRLNDRQRATIQFLLDRVVGTIEDELRAGLADVFADDAPVHAALASAHVAIARPLLDLGGVLRDRELIGALLRRVEEHRLYRAATPNIVDGLLRELIRDADPLIAADAMAMLVATSRRLDRFLEPVTARTELAADLQHRLVWGVAAALRVYLTRHHAIAPERVDAALAAAAASILDGYDEGDTLDARAMRLARSLDAAGRLDDMLIARAAAEGSLPLLLAALAVRVGLGLGAVWEIVAAPGDRGVPLLLRAAGVARAPAGTILLRLAGERRSEDQVAAALALYDALDRGAAFAAIRLWAFDPAYRDGVVAIGAAA